MAALTAGAIGSAAEACRAPPGSRAVPGSVAAATPGDPAALHRAWFEAPTTAYAHGVLGDASEPTRLHALSADTSAGCGLSVGAGPGHVFEDLAPRLTDVDGDGLPEIVVVRSSATAGAQLAVYRRAGEELVPWMATPFIGTRFRWLAPAAWGDLDGDGAWEVAYVDRPHLARTLRVWRHVDGALVEVAALAGVTNHRIGEAYISGGLRDCGAGPEIVLASADWSRTVVVTFDGARLAARDDGPWRPRPGGGAPPC